jgi:Hypoxia induced protein conserved region
VPIGCIATAYFLFSGIRSFQKRDPVRSQRMMKNRVIAQFVTLLCFMGYMGIEQADFRIAPMVQDKYAAEKQKQQENKTTTTAGE